MCSIRVRGVSASPSGSTDEDEAATNLVEVPITWTSISMSPTTRVLFGASPSGITLPGRYRANGASGSRSTFGPAPNRSPPEP